MRTKNLVVVLALVFAAANLSANGDSSQQRETPPSVVVGVVHDVTVDGDNVIVHLYREPYDVISVKWQRVHAFDGREMYAGDLIEQDNVRIEGDPRSAQPVPDGAAHQADEQDRAPRR